MWVQTLVWRRSFQARGAVVGFHFDHETRKRLSRTVNCPPTRCSNSGEARPRGGGDGLRGFGTCLIFWIVLRRGQSARRCAARARLAARAPRAATPPRRRAAWLRIFVVRCGRGPGPIPQGGGTAIGTPTGHPRRCEFLKPLIRRCFSAADRSAGLALI